MSDDINNCYLSKLNNTRYIYIFLQSNKLLMLLAIVIFVSRSSFQFSVIVFLSACCCFRPLVFRFCYLESLHKIINKILRTTATSFLHLSLRCRYLSNTLFPLKRLCKFTSFVCLGFKQHTTIILNTNLILPGKGGGGI